MTNCDVKAREEDKSKPGKELYGKKILTSHKPYDIWREDEGTYDINTIGKLYYMFLVNMYALEKVFETKWVHPSELLTATRGLVWDWSSEEELERTAKDIEENGVYFPIYTLPAGILHNQIISEEEQAALSAKGLYNSYNGNHRIDAIQYLVENGRWPKGKKVLIYIIPPFCQKSCTGFKYDPIDDMVECELTKHKLPLELTLVHLDLVEHEMKVTNWRDRTEVSPGISMVRVDDYNVAFRVSMEIQNVLEPALASFYKEFNTLPEFILEMNPLFNEQIVWEEMMRKDEI